MDTQRTYKCFNCEHKFDFGYMYRCFDCKAWLCEDCIRNHFGNQHEPHPLHLKQWEEKLARVTAERDAVGKPTGDMVMVPREPTMEMIEAGIGTFDDDFKSWDQVDINSCWSAMLAAAPIAPEGKDVRIIIDSLRVNPTAEVAKEAAALLDRAYGVKEITAKD